MSAENQEIRDLILLATLPHVVFEGWTTAALHAGVDSLGEVPGLDENAGERAFPGGMVDMAGHLSNWADRRMVAEMAKLDIAGMKVRERIASGVRLRLQVLAPHREAVRRLLAFLALPQNAGLAISSGYATVSEIWYAAGDESADFNFYTKRALLAPVLALTTLYWLADDGDGAGEYPETWAFLDRRIADVLKIPPLKAKLIKGFTHMPTPIGTFRRFATAVRARRS